ncbi:MAG: Zn-dependent alcohol dehydrogenase [Hyphomicrobiales bacterium]|nr:Zn-dependent alcohol dehydrogenase [Hyphomicrobiales bacterium]MDE2018345.1 Zn-dependent alcohol dehydrogenase [Hyphomicrobiales bacterium]
MKSRAAVCRAFGKPMSIEEIEVADPGPGEVRVALAATAICHSDISYAEGAWGGPLPAVYGHESAGRVIDVGPGVAGLKPGDPVVVTLIRSCGACRMCVSGKPVFCEATFPLDDKGPISTRAGEPLWQAMRVGGFAEHVTVHASQAIKVEIDVPLDEAALVACAVITGVGAVTRSAGVRMGESVVVIGAGGVGLNAVQGARLVGADPIVAMDVAPAKLEAAKRFGATHAVDARAPDAKAQVKAITGGRYADHVFVTVGAKSAIEAALPLIARAGTVVLVGMPASGVTAEIDPTMIAATGQRIVGSKMGDAQVALDVPRLLSLRAEGRLKLGELISGRFPLERIDEAIEGVRSGAALRNVIAFRGEGGA